MFEGGLRLYSEVTMNRETIVIGGGQAGLVTGYYLAQRNIPFRILDANPQIGDAWRNRWDSLRLFSLARYSGLPGMKIPMPGNSFPTNDQMADYLKSYAAHFKLPVETGVRIDRLSKRDGRFYIRAGERRYEAEQVIVAMGDYQKPRVPPFAHDLDPAIMQMHSSEYRSPSQLREGDALVVGVGNSGADIALEIAKTRRTWLAGKETGQIPFRIDHATWPWLGARIIRFVGHHVLSVRTPIGRRLRPKLLRGHAPLVRVKTQDLDAADVQRGPRVAGVRRGFPLLADGRVLRAANVIWCTGYTAGFSWIDLPIFDDAGLPIHERGIVTDVAGLYFVGLHFQSAMSSGTLIGVGRDAEYVVRSAAARLSAKDVDRVLEISEHGGRAVAARGNR